VRYRAVALPPPRNGTTPPCKGRPNTNAVCTGENKGVCGGPIGGKDKDKGEFGVTSAQIHTKGLGLRFAQVHRYITGDNKN
jgi:hypothetical protein